jgi:SAM-dependent methyltransferase
MTDELDFEQRKARLAGDYSIEAAAYDAYWGPVLADLAVHFVQDIRLAEAQTILDVGAGSGSMLRYLQGATDAMIVGVDRSPGMIALASGRLRAVMDAERLGFKQASFDTALAMFVLFHLPDPVAGLREIHRVLTLDGTVAFTTWGNHDPEFRAYDVFDEVLDRHGAAEGSSLYARHELSDTPDKCAALLEESGFEVSSIRAERMAHQWSIDHLIGCRTQLGYGRVRWASLDAHARSNVMEEGRAALAQLAADEMILRDEVIYSMGKAVDKL